MPNITCYRMYTHFWTTNPNRQLTHNLSSYNLYNLLPTYKYFNVSNYHSSIYLPKNHSINQSIHLSIQSLASSPVLKKFPLSPDRITKTPHLNVLNPTLSLLVLYFLDVETVQTSAWDRQEIPVERIHSLQILRAKNGSGKKR